MYSHYELGRTELIFDFQFGFHPKCGISSELVRFFVKKIKIRFGTSDTHERIKQDQKWWCHDNCNNRPNDSKQVAVVVVGI